MEKQYKIQEPSGLLIEDKTPEENTTIIKPDMDKDYLRSYLFFIMIEGDKEAAKTTTAIRNINWTKDEIIIDSLLDEADRIYNLLLEAKKLKVCFLKRDGSRTNFTSEFILKGLKYGHPLNLNQEEGLLVYRFYYEY